MPQTYKDFAPTAFDSHITLEDRENWIVAPVSITRDTVESVTLANWQSMLEALGDESDTVEVHRFGHWGPGWFELILVHPSRSDEIEEIESALENYPVLNDEKMSSIEADQEYEAFESWLASDISSKLQHYEHPTCHTYISTFDVHSTEIDYDLSDYWDDIDTVDQYGALRSAMDDVNVYWEHTSEGPSISLTNELIQTLAFTLTDGE